MKHKGFIGLAIYFVTAGIFLFNNTYAETNATDNISVSIPVSCSMTRTIDSEHTATVSGGTYQQDIGKSTFQVFCNDAEGFSIYAVGYSGDTYGNTTMIPTTVDTSNSIVTGTATSGSTSNWAMKLAAVSGTYAPTLETGFNTYHSVPNEYTKVASFAATTDGTIGSSFESTYAVYATATQPGDTYTGKVKYTVVHPSNDSPVADNRIRVIFDANGLEFPGGATTNTVEYANVCTDIEGYVGSDYREFMSPNVNTGGTPNRNYTSEDSINQTITIEGADKLKIDINYELTQDSASISINNPVDWSGDSISDWENNISGTKTIVIDGDSVQIDFYSYNNSEEGYGLGIYARIYPVYDEPQSGATYAVLGQNCSWQAVSGTYAETTIWNGSWDAFFEEAGEEYHFTFSNEDDLTKVIKDLIDEKKYISLGTTINLSAYHPYTITYDGNGATAGTMTGFNSIYKNENDTIKLLAPNFYKTGYGFAGWSEDSSATVNSNSKIFGPNEIITASELSYDSNRTTTLYAVWVPSTGNFQNWTGCSSMNIGSVTALSDSRDNNTYTIAKLADGNCWMIENLRLDHTANITTSNTQSNNGSWGGVFVGLADSETSFYGTTANSLYTINSSQTNLNLITGSGATYRFPRYNNNNSSANINNNSLEANPRIDVGDKWYSYRWYGYGNYYTWAAAVADTTYYISETVSSTSICPTNWHLPTGSSSGELANLSVSLGGTTDVMRGDTANAMMQALFSYPNNFTFTCGSFNWCNIGQYWSSTSYSDSIAYSLYIQNDYITPTANQSGSQKNLANAIRCIAD